MDGLACSREHYAEFSGETVRIKSNVSANKPTQKTRKSATEARNKITCHQHYENTPIQYKTIFLGKD